MSFALPQTLRVYIDARVAAGDFGNTSEYIRELIRKDRDEQAKKRLLDLIEEGLASGAGPARTTADDEELLPSLAASSIETGDSSPQARRDQQSEVPYFRGKADSRIAEQLVSATNGALDQLELNPGIGSPVLGKVLDIHDLRT